MNTKRLAIVNSLSGALGLLAFPPVNWYWLGFVCLVPHFVFLVQETRGLRLFWGVWLFRSILFVGLGYYFFEPIFYATSLLIFVGIVPVLLIMKKLISLRRGDSRQRPILMMVLVGVCYLAFDYLQARYSFLPAFVAISGAMLGNSPFVGLARFGGVIGLSGFIVLINAVFAGGWLWAASRRSQPAALAVPRALVVAGVLNGLLVGAGLLLSQDLLAQNRAAYEDRPHVLKIAAVSVGQAFTKETERFWDYETTDAIVQAVTGDVHALKEALRFNPTRPDLVIFPEDMVDLEFWGVSDSQAYERFTITNAGPLIARYRKIAQELESPLLFVLTTIEQSGRYNSALLIDSAGDLSGIYHKIHLAIAMESWPFGRFHPFYFDWRFDKDARYESPIYNPAYQYRFGESVTMFEPTSGLTLGTPICIEVHYPHRIQDFVRRGADALFNTSSNMAITYGLRLYLDLTLNLRRIEAVWLRLPIIFCGRRDDAGMVLPDGTADLVEFSDTETFHVYSGTVRY